MVKDWLATFLVVFGVLILAVAVHVDSTPGLGIGVAMLTFGIRYTIDRGRVR